MIEEDAYLNCYPPFSPLLFKVLYVEIDLMADVPKHQNLTEQQYLRYVKSFSLRCLRF